MKFKFKRIYTRWIPSFQPIVDRVVITNNGASGIKIGRMVAIPLAVCHRTEAVRLTSTRMIVLDQTSIVRAGMAV
jgi:hypothetical protein